MRPTLLQSKPWSVYVERVARAAARRLDTKCLTLSIQTSEPSRPSIPSISTSSTPGIRAERFRPCLAKWMATVRVGSHVVTSAGDVRHHATSTAREDRFERSPLVGRRPLVDVDSGRPVALAHRPRRVDHESRVRSVEGDGAEPPALDREHHRDVARPFRRPRHGPAPGVSRAEQARAEDLAVAVLEILALDCPRLRHAHPPAVDGRGHRTT